MVFQLWADVQLYLMKWWHWQHWWRCNAIQELQALSDIAFSANFESDDDEEGGRWGGKYVNDNEMFLSDFRAPQGQGAQIIISLKGPVTTMMNTTTLPKLSNISLSGNFQKSTKQIGQKYIYKI